MNTEKTRRNPRINFNKGFTLIELMMVVAILGLLVSIIAPAFNVYYQQAKSVEALQSLGIFHQGQYVSYQQTQRFGTCESLSSMTAEHQNSWASGEKFPLNSVCTHGVGFPVLDNTHSYFIYQTFAGKYSADNTLDPLIPAAENSPTSAQWFGLKGPSLGACLGVNALSSVTGESFGLNAAPPAGYAYYVTVATANFNGNGSFSNIGDDICHIAFRYAVFDRTVSEEVFSSPVVVYAGKR